MSRLRQSDAGRHSKQPTGPTWVRDECHCLARMFSTDVRPHHTASLWPSLATSATADRVQTRCAHFQLHACHGSTIPCTQTVPCGRHGLSSSTPFRFDARAASSTKALHHRQRPCFRSLHSSRLEYSAVWRHDIAITDRLQTTAQDTALQPLVWSPTVWLLFLNRVTLPLNLFLLLSALEVFWLHGTIIIFVHNNNNSFKLKPCTASWNICTVSEICTKLSALWLWQFDEVSRRAFFTGGELRGDNEDICNTQQLTYNVTAGYLLLPLHQHATNTITAS